MLILQPILPILGTYIIFIRVYFSLTISVKNIKNICFRFCFALDKEKLADFAMICTQDKDHMVPAVLMAGKAIHLARLDR